MAPIRSRAARELPKSGFSDRPHDSRFRVLWASGDCAPRSGVRLVLVSAHPRVNRTSDQALALSARLSVSRRRGGRPWTSVDMGRLLRNKGERERLSSPGRFLLSLRPKKRPRDVTIAGPNFIHGLSACYKPNRVILKRVSSLSRSRGPPRGRACSGASLPDTPFGVPTPPIPAARLWIA